jgi:hypothetical protein
VDRENWTINQPPSAAVAYLNIPTLIETRPALVARGNSERVRRSAAHGVRTMQKNRQYRLGVPAGIVRSNSNR